MVSYLVLETSYYTTQQFKCHKNLEAYNQMVRGSVTAVQDKIIARKHVVVGKGGHTQSESKCLVCIRHYLIRTKCRHFRKDTLSVTEK